MRIRWTTTAADDLASIVEYIWKDNPEAAQRVAEVVFESIATLGKFPNRGRIGRVENTREIVFTPWPYIAVYEIIDDQVLVLRIRHGAQDWP